jgi:hypothetical protein
MTREALFEVDLDEGGWQAVPVRLIEHATLSRGAVGFAAWLFCRRGGFKIRVSCFPRLLTNDVEHVGREKLRRWISELETAGYVRRDRRQGKDGRWEWTFKLVREPEPRPINGFPVDGESVGGQAVCGSPISGRPADKQQTLITARPELQKRTTTTEQVVVVGLDEPPLLAHRGSILKSLQSCAVELHQQIVDEVLGAAATGSIRKNAGSYARGLCAAAQAGTFVPQAGIAVAAARRRRKEEDARRIAEETERRRRETPEARAAARKARDEALARLGRPARPSSVVANSATGGGEQ